MQEMLLHEKLIIQKERCKFSSSRVHRKFKQSKFEVIDSTQIHLMHTIHCQVHQLAFQSHFKNALDVH